MGRSWWAGICSFTFKTRLGDSQNEIGLKICVIFLNTRTPELENEIITCEVLSNIEG